MPECSDFVRLSHKGFCPAGVLEFWDASELHRL
jgi:hypothetical protein